MSFAKTSFAKTSFAKKLFAVSALLALSGCATGLTTRVSRFQAMPAPAGQTFFIQPADERDRGGLEFGRYAELVRQAMISEGYTPAATPTQASLRVTLDYGVDDGRTAIRSVPGAFGGFGFGRSPFYSRFGFYGGYRSAFTYGFDDPFLLGGGGFSDIRSYTVYNSYLDLDIRSADGRSLFEGLVQARSRTDALPALVPNLVEAMFTGFPGRSGETVRITVQPPERRR